MKHQCFIASYSRDLPWLEHCLTSLNKFAVGFLPPVVCVSSDDVAGAEQITSFTCPDAIITVKDGRPNQGFMRAQLGMMEADIYCPDADVIYFLGSDCIAYKEFRPEQYCQDGKPVVLMTARETLQSIHSGAMPWLVGTERILGFPPPYEYMRRLPTVYPRAIFERMRSYVSDLHAIPFEDYIYETDAIEKNTSEANILGAYAHRFMPETCHWVPTENMVWGPNGVDTGSILQMHSWSGLEKPMDANVTLPDGTQTFGLTPRFVIEKILG